MIFEFVLYYLPDTVKHIVAATKHCYIHNMTPKIYDGITRNSYTSEKRMSFYKLGNFGELP